MKRAIISILVVILLMLAGCGQVQETMQEETVEEPAAEPETVEEPEETVEEEFIQEDVIEEEPAEDESIIKERTIVEGVDTPEEPEEVEEEEPEVRRWYFSDEEIAEIQKVKLLQGTKIAIPGALQKLDIGESYLFAVRLITYDPHENYGMTLHVKNVEEKIGMSFHPVDHSDAVVKEWIKTDAHHKFKMNVAEEIVIPIGMTVGDMVGPKTETRSDMRITFDLDIYKADSFGRKTDEFAKGQQLIIRVN